MQRWLKVQDDVAEELRWLRLAAHTARLSGDYVAAQFFERQRAGLQQAVSASPLPLSDADANG